MYFVYCVFYSIVLKILGSLFHNSSSSWCLYSYFCFVGFLIALGVSYRVTGDWQDNGFLQEFALLRRWSLGHQRFWDLSKLNSWFEILTTHVFCVIRYSWFVALTLNSLVFPPIQLLCLKGFDFPFRSMTGD